MVATQSASGKAFYSIVKGKFRRKVEEPTEGATKRENKNGNVVYELCFDRLSGDIDSINLVKTDFGKMIHIGIDGEVLSIPFDSNEGRAFIKMLPNMKNEPTEFNVFIGDDDKTAFIIRQGGETVKWAFTRSNPNGMPPAVQKEVAGETKWDFTDQVDFLYKTLIKESERFGFASTKEQVKPNNDKDFPDPPTEDLPF